MKPPGVRLQPEHFNYVLYSSDIDRQYTPHATDLIRNKFQILFNVENEGKKGGRAGDNRGGG